MFIATQDAQEGKIYPVFMEAAKIVLHLFFTHTAPFPLGAVVLSSVDFYSLEMESTVSGIQ